MCVVASYEPMRRITLELLQWLRRPHRSGGGIGAFETGALVLAAAGLLEGRRVTVPWEVTRFGRLLGNPVA
jgi:AraC family carnitine catabolism transcriptional activator